ncbi:MAG: hypothetical protein J5878_04500 [Oscillospiraceae bacterium]|nr:hypothetical protein [Oscillospiraceae bacterium]
MKRRVILLVAIVPMLLLTTLVASAKSTLDKAWCEEYFSWWWKYDGNLEFVPSYVTPSNPGYELKSGKRVKQGYINFTRKSNGVDTSVIGGRKWTREASDKKSNAVYSVSATATDSLNIFTNKTHFWWNWVYFS